MCLLTTKSTMAKYNLYIKTQLSSYNIWEISEEQLEKVILAYKQGKDSFTLSGKQYYLSRLMAISIFTSEKPRLDETNMSALSQLLKDINRTLTGDTYYTDKTLSSFGSDVTNDKLGNSEYGCEKELVSETNVKQPFINEDRIKQLSEIKSDSFDLSKLIALCNEINIANNSSSYYSVLMLIRSIIDHIPPILGVDTFNNVANNYSGGSKSFKKSMIHLNDSMRNIADSYLHQSIRKKENNPNDTQINYSPDVDLLLDEIIRVLKLK